MPPTPDISPTQPDRRTCDARHPGKGHDDAVVPASDRWESAVEVRLHNGLHIGDDAVPEDEPRRLHAMNPATQSPACGALHAVLPTFEQWSTTSRPGIKICDECSSLAPRHQGR